MLLMDHIVRLKNQEMNLVDQLKLLELMLLGTTLLESIKQDLNFLRVDGILWIILEFVGGVNFMNSIWFWVLLPTFIAVTLADHFMLTITVLSIILASLVRVGR